MSHGPSTFGTITTSILSPISPTICVRSSSTQGDSRAFTRVHSAVCPRSLSRPPRAPHSPPPPPTPPPPPARAPVGGGGQPPREVARGVGFFVPQQGARA